MFKSNLQLFIKVKLTSLIFELAFTTLLKQYLRNSPVNETIFRKADIEAKLTLSCKQIPIRSLCSVRGKLIAIVAMIYFSGNFIDTQNMLENFLCFEKKQKSKIVLKPVNFFLKK